ncbi:hypothetical protein BJ878DRAFT_559258 [Calycina marina]|uniref:Uncharacterized protein n=1 Tax=Calycina marina TaxID=1763456 RepID=A0A9P7YXK2_9HELO|nr:hypothetical protein BJ878DRAFT_559258 [Calycina marina]
MTTHQTAKTNYAAHSRGKVAYRRLGASSEVPLLFFIHFRGTMDKWDQLFVNSIATARPELLVDYVGVRVGQSTGTIASSFRQSGDDMIDLLSSISVKEVDIMGFSIGGFVTGTNIGQVIEESTNPCMVTATAEATQVTNSKELFFANNSIGDEAAEKWWARIPEQKEATGGEAPSQWFS